MVMLATVAHLISMQLSERSAVVTCFLVYEVVTYQLSEGNTTNHGVQIPRVVQFSQSSDTVYLSLTLDSDLFVNKEYLATITAINADGGRNISVTINFGINIELNHLQDIKLNLCLKNCRYI